MTAAHLHHRVPRLGAPLDSTSGLYDLKARMYEPGTGRFATEDPVAGFAAMPETLNPYAYGYDNPLAYPDPNGDCPICLVAGAYLLKNAAQSASFSAGEYYLTHRAEIKENGVDWADFGKTVGYDALTGSINPLGRRGKRSRRCHCSSRSTTRAPGRTTLGLCSVR